MGGGEHAAAAAVGADGGAQAFGQSEDFGCCIERAAAGEDEGAFGLRQQGDGLVEEPTRLAFPFNLQPRPTSR